MGCMLKMGCNSCRARQCRARQLWVAAMHFAKEDGAQRLCYCVAQQLWVAIEGGCDGVGNEVKKWLACSWSVRPLRRSEEKRVWGLRG